MARIPEEEIERLKREVSVQRLAEARGVKLEAARSGPHRPVSLPRRPRSTLVISPRKKSLELSRSVPRGRRLPSTG